MHSPAGWDERYRRSLAPSEPSSLLVNFCSFFSQAGRALDIACGGGRNAVYLAGRGLDVVGIDYSWQALKQGRELARQRQVKVAWVQGDLEKLEFAPQAFDVVICFYYRDPQLYERIRNFLRPGGLIFYESYTSEQLYLGVGPRNPAHLLVPGELLKAFGGWPVIYYRETWTERAVASLVARKPSG